MVRIVYIENNKFKEKWFDSSKEATDYIFTTPRLTVSECKYYDKREDAKPIKSYPK